MVALVVQVAPAAMLARWVRPDQGLVQAALWVPVARMATVEMAAPVVLDGVRHLLAWQVATVAPAEPVATVVKALQVTVVTVELVVLGSAGQIHM